MTTPRIAPFVLVRLAALPHPSAPPAARPFRAAVNSLVAVESRVDSLGRELSDALYASASGHSAEFHRRVVLPLRRDIHNGRTPKPVDLGDLPDRVPLLRQWLSARAELAAATVAVLRHWPSALAAERSVLASLCAEEPLRRAAVLTGRDLLHGLDRTADAAGNPDRKARKAEPTVLRYALRATSKTSPLSWYTYVSWGRWASDSWLGESPAGRAEVNHVLLARLTAALVSAHRDSVPHRLAPALREQSGRFTFQRDIPAHGATRAYVTSAETVEIPATAPLQFLISVVQAGVVTPSELTSALAARMPAAQASAAAQYVAKLMDIGLLVPTAPVDPQGPDAASALVSWLRSRDPGLAGRLAELVHRTKSFTELDAQDRGARLAELEAGWETLGSALAPGAARQEPASASDAPSSGATPILTGVPPVAEDVVLPGIARLGPAHGQAATGTLARLTPLLMAFDRQLLIRRIARNRFVAQFGAGGSAHPADCAELLSGALIEALAGPASETSEEIGAIRSKLAAMVTAGEINDDMISTAAELLPQWTKSRPVAYSWFVQPLPGGELVVNHCYAGFARFTSRFLGQLPAEARTDVADYLHEVFDGGFTQYRPVGGFNANLHPMLTDEEIGEDPLWADITPDDIVVRHDQVADELRLVHQRTGRTLDVLYLGFLMPLMLPDRVSALYTDMSCGWPDLNSLRSTVDRGDVVEQGGLRYRDVILARRSWEFGGQAAEGLRTGFSAGDENTALAAARLRARFGLPEHVFVGAGGGITSMADFEQNLAAPKPQYADLGNALHTRCIHRVFNRHTGDIRLTEALPVPSGQVLELIAETWWRAP
jgi:hypothetical protein